MMQREFKYRVWNGEDMISPDYITRDGTAWWKENSIPTCSKKLIQSTGLKDEEGVEIWEGDLVTGDDVVFRQVQYVPKHAGYWPFAKDDGCGCCSEGCGWKSEEMRVVGNIYENPEIEAEGPAEPEP